MQIGQITYTVNSTGSSPSDGSGTSGTLPYVIAKANANKSPAGSKIMFDASVFKLPQTIDLASTLVLSETAGPEEIDGTGVSKVTVKGGINYGVIEVSPSTTADVILLTIAGGWATQGGGIDNKGTLTLSDVTLSKNTAISGGAIFNSGTLTVKGGTIAGNTGYRYGGGIDNDGGDVKISGGCSITGNGAPGYTTSSGSRSDGSGGGIYESGGKVTIAGGTIAKNSARIDGGGICVPGGVLTISGDMVSGNSAYNGGGMDVSGGHVQINDGCSIAGNRRRTSAAGPFRTAVRSRLPAAH